MSDQKMTPANHRATLELLYHVSRELTTALDLRTVLQRVLFLAMKNVGAQSGSILVLDDSGQPIESAQIRGSSLFDDTTQQLRMTLDRGLAGWVFNNRQAVLINDTTRDQRWIDLPDSLEEDKAPKSAVSAPLLARERIAGVITLVHPQTSYFSMDHLELVQAIADQAGIAVLNARLYAESQRQARVMTALAETAAVINATIRMDEVYERLMDQIGQALRVQAASLALVEPGGQELVFRAATGWVGKQVIGVRMPLGKGIAGWVAQSGQGIIVPNVQVDMRFDPETDKRTGYRTVSIACAPIWLRGEVIGVLEAINPTGGKFDGDALVVLNGIGNLAGTAIRHAQLFESLEAAHQRYRELFEDSIDPIVITGLDGTIVEANRQAALASGYPAEQLRGMHIQALNTLEQKTLDCLANAGEAATYESELHQASGAVAPVEVHARPVSIDGVKHLQWILRDIAERKRLDSLRDDLIAMVYHDLRSPLANVLSSLEVLNGLLPAAEDGGEDDARSMLKIARRSTERIQRLTNSLLDFNRLKSGSAILSLEPVRIQRLAEDAIEAVDLVAAGKQQQLTLQIPADLPEITVDQDLMRRVLINLVENAIKYTPARGAITIGASQNGDALIAWVQDNGRGIPAEELEHVFDKFTRLRSPDDEAKGLGLGLTFCRLAVQAHGGKIWVESQPGDGARFSLSLPLQPANPS